ncbi:MAG TPA: hypothetical protein VMV04_15825 [Thermodesulfobacteriota bacterium]|nr:hypothetical protein [Thermodesulfobacteriota bacterium]
MRTKSILLIFCIVYFPLAFLRVAPAQDWAFELGDEAKEIYAKKKIQIPCKRLDDLLRKDDINGLHTAIRDAALFGDKTCDKYIKKNLNRLKQTEARDAVAFYYYKKGDVSQLELLANSYDKDAPNVGDHFTVDLFGFINEWEITGRRLVRHAECCHDAVGGEALCSAIIWRRYLYGDKDFKHFWFKIGKEENVSPENLQHFYSDCQP